MEIMEFFAGMARERVTQIEQNTSTLKEIEKLRSQVLKELFKWILKS